MLFFVTPVFWSIGMLGDHTWIASINPMFHILEILRQPLLGKSASCLSYVTVIAIGFSLILVGLIVFKKNRNKLAFWA
jgi:lipopolysaccharide transport system permease protein